MAFEHVYNGMVKRAGGSAWDAFTEKLKDPEFLKNIGMGLGAAGLTGLGTYALSGLIPGAKKERGLRLLASILAGTGVGSAVSYYGKDIRDYLSNYFGSKNDPATAP